MSRINNLKKRSIKNSITGYWTKFTFYFLVSMMMKNSDTVKRITIFSGINCYFMIFFRRHFILRRATRYSAGHYRALTDGIFCTKNKNKHYTYFCQSKIISFEHTPHLIWLWLSFMVHCLICWWVRAQKLYNWIKWWNSE